MAIPLSRQSTYAKKEILQGPWSCSYSYSIPIVFTVHNLVLFLHYIIITFHYFMILYESLRYFRTDLPEAGNIHHIHLGTPGAATGKPLSSGGVDMIRRGEPRFNAAQDQFKP